MADSLDSLNRRRPFATLISSPCLIVGTNKKYLLTHIFPDDLYAPTAAVPYVCRLVLVQAEVSPALLGQQNRGALVTFQAENGAWTKQIIIR